MKAILQSWPPLGQVSCVMKGQIDMSVVLEASDARRNEPWEVSLWCSVDSQDWAEQPMSRTKASQEPYSLCGPPHGSTHLYYSCSLSFAESVQFTVRFRNAAGQPWRWVRDEEALNDGTVIVQTPNALGDSLQDYIPDLDSTWAVTSRISQSPGTQLWSLECSSPAATGQQSAYHSVSIGTPWGSFKRWFALVRHNPPWLGPRHGKRSFSISEDAILCTFLSKQGRNMAFLAVSGLDHISTTFRHTKTGGIRAQARNDATSEGNVAVLVAEGADFENVVASVMYHARSLVSNNANSQTLDSKAQGKSLAKGQQQWKADWIDGLGYCTWNALGQRLSKEKVLNAVRKLADNNINIRNLIIDDNWQSLHSINDGSESGWAEFEANRSEFPGGLRSLTTEIRKLHPYVQHISVWHALLGYWGGISPRGDIAQHYNTVIAQREDDSSAPLTVVAAADAHRLYDDFYSFLAESGINGVKADDQIIVDQLLHAPDRRDLIFSYFDAQAAAARKHFGKTTISCMSQFPLAIFRAQLPHDEAPILVRNSDDYFPDIPRSHPWHVWTNAHNVILTRFLNAVPDWDMFQTVHEYSAYHAAARCVSGGPIYITDVPGEHDLDLMAQMTAITPDSQTIVLRPSTLGRSVTAYAGYDDDVLLKVGSYNGDTDTGTGILAVFNVSERDLAELVPLASIPGIVPSSAYVVRAHKTGRVSKPVCHLSNNESLFTLSLGVGDYEILTAFPATRFESAAYGACYVATLGLLGKMTGCAAITRAELRRKENGQIVSSTRLKALGILGIYISTLPNMIIEKHLMAVFQDRPVPREMVRRSREDEHVFEVDVEQVWRRFGMDGQQTSEIEVKVYFSG